MNLLNFEKRLPPKLNKLITRINSSNIGGRIASGAFWSIFGTASAKCIVLIAGIICANILGSEKYGELGLVRSTINMFVVFGTFGIGVTATKYISQYRKDSIEKMEMIYSLTTSFSVIMATIITALILIFSPIIANSSLNAPHLVVEIRIGAILLFATILNGLQFGILSGLEDFKSQAINTLISSLFEGLFIIVGAIYAGVLGAVLGYGVGIVVLYLLNHCSIKKKLKKVGITFSLSKIKTSDLSILVNFSLPAALSSFLVAPTYWIARTILVKYSGFSELGIYEAADQWKVIILFIPAALSKIILPILSSFKEYEYESYVKTLKYNIILNAGVSLVFAIIVVLLSPMIMRSYGAGFSNTTPLIILAFSTVFSSITTVIGVSIQSREKVWQGFLFNFMWACMFIVLSYISVHLELGASGIAMAVLISYIVHALVQYVYLYKIIKL